MTNKIFNCADYDSKKFDNKRLMVFEDDLGGRTYRISSLVSLDDRTFTLNRTAIGIASVSVNNENQIAVVTKPIDETIFRMMEKPNSRFLNNQCDFVVFLNSPRRKAQYAEPNRATTKATSLQEQTNR
jgi:hypothetical protein